jgi:hypothetical protein
MIRASMLAATLLASGLAGAAQAQQMVNQGEQFEVRYPAGYAGNIVGEGEVLRTVGESPRVIYAAPLHSLPPGIPHQPGGQSQDVAYLRAPQPFGRHVAER